jgi:hypothetical protein
MTTFTKITRPTNLSRWAFFANEKDQNFDQLAGGDREYILRVRAANKPVVTVLYRHSGKYRWNVAIDMIEGFDDQHRVKLSPFGSQLAFDIMHSVSSVQTNNDPLFVSFGDARYSSIDDAIFVANLLTALPNDCFIFIE